MERGKIIHYVARFILSIIVGFIIASIIIWIVNGAFFFGLW